MHEVRYYVCIIFVYIVVYFDISTRSSQINHLNLESLRCGIVTVTKVPALTRPDITVMVDWA